MANLRALSRDFRRLAKATTKAGLDAAQDIGRVAQNEGRRLSRGPFSSQQLKDRDHPFAKRHGAPRLPTEIINRQSGLFEKSWVLGYLNLPGGLKTVLVYNTAPYADSLEHGTKNAFSRPVDIAIELRIIDTAPFIVRRRIEAAMTQGPFTRK